MSEWLHFPAPSICDTQYSMKTKKKKEKNFSTCILLISAVFERVISTKPVTIGVFPVNLNIPESSVSHFFFFQINRAPSFGTDQKIDYDVKKGVLLNALKLLNIRYLVLFSLVHFYFCCFDIIFF